MRYGVSMLTTSKSREVPVRNVR